jgi:hypothetical protein
MERHKPGDGFKDLAIPRHQTKTTLFLYLLVGEIRGPLFLKSHHYWERRNARINLYLTNWKLVENRATKKQGY